MISAPSDRARFVVIQPAGADQGLVTGELRAGTPELAPVDVARAVAANPLWRQESRIAVVFRPEPNPLIGVLGNFKHSHTQLDAMGWQVEWLLTHLRYVDYRQAETSAERLATTLSERFGPKTLSSLRFTAIPRGGLIVLGMVSYLLNLRQEQLFPSANITRTGAPLVVIDDCALTGYRFREFLGQFPDEEIVFAHLYSHPELRRAILDRESRVIACLSAHDLHDFAPDVLGTRYEGWRERVWAQAGASRYWIGMPEHICFAWNEPDSVIWNSTTETMEAGWRVLPPDLCLKNRAPADTEPIPVQIQPEGKGPLKPSGVALFGTVENEVILGNVETGSSYSLKGAAADIWQALVRHGNVDGTVAELGQIYDVDEDHLRADVEAFVSQLMAAGLLVHTSEGAGEQ